jgi:hypothetical protein
MFDVGKRLPERGDGRTMPRSSQNILYIWSLGGAGNPRSKIVGAAAKATTKTRSVVDACGLHSTRFFSSLRMIIPAATSLQGKPRLRRCAIESANRSLSVLVLRSRSISRSPQTYRPHGKSPGQRGLGLRGKASCGAPVGANRKIHGCYSPLSLVCSECR